MRQLEIIDHDNMIHDEIALVMGSEVDNFPQF